MIWTETYTMLYSKNSLDIKYSYHPIEYCELYNCESTKLANG